MGLFDFLFGKKDKQKAAPVRNTTNTTRTSETRRLAPSTRPQPKASTSSSEPKSFSTNMLQGVDLGGPFKLVPLDMGIFESKDFPMLGLLASTTPELAKWLPGFDLASPESAQKYLRACVLRTEMGLGFTYLIKFNSGVCGMIFVNTPTYNQTTIGFPYWSCDFFLFKPMQGQGLMPKILLGFLLFLKNVFKIHNMYSIVDSKNTACLNMFDKCLFFAKQPDMVFTDPSTGNKAIAFKCDLTSLDDPFAHLH